MSLSPRSQWLKDDTRRQALQAIIILSLPALHTSSIPMPRSLHSLVCRGSSWITLPGEDTKRKERLGRNAS